MCGDVQTDALDRGGYFPFLVSSPQFENEMGDWVYIERGFNAYSDARFGSMRNRPH